MHFYSHQKDGSWKFLKSIETEAQARKSPSNPVPSVTTVLALLPSGFLDLWKIREAARLAREGLSDEEIPSALWGTRECPDTWEIISSADFGTNAHKFMEHWAESLMEGSDPDYQKPYAAVCKEACATLEQMGVVPLESEAMYGSVEDACCGTVDLVAELDGKLALFDFKTRACGGKQSKTYDKDAAQLAIESKWVKETKQLDYMPDIYSVCICTDSGKAWVKKWSDEKFKRGIRLFEAARKLYLADKEF